MKHLWIMSTIMLFYMNAAFSNTNNFLERFGRNPQLTAKELPEKTGSRMSSLFSSSVIKTRDFVIAKDEFRQRVLCAGVKAGETCHSNLQFNLLEKLDEDKNLKSFIGESYEANIFKLSLFNEGLVESLPWSGHYWPIYQGGIGARYGDPKFPNSESFKVNYKYFKASFLKPPGSKTEDLARLSPAEKYDLILGDDNWNMTRSVWADGSEMLKENGKVETWMGICHGWAPAAISMLEPKKTFDINLPNGKGLLRLFPHDIKALVSQFWATAEFNYEVLGGRCNNKNPKADENGRIISPECFDINPATWHLALTHLVGRDHKSFILDAIYDYEVWNQPIVSYKLEYFNPINLNHGKIEESIVEIKNMKKDPYQKYRSSEVRYLVGVIAHIKYIVEEDPQQIERISDPISRQVSVSYFYDLELDLNHNIIGGEWYQQAHPDMLWKPAIGSLAKLKGEEKIEDWDGNLPIPIAIYNLGIYASSHKMPLFKILDKFVEWAQDQR